MSTIHILGIESSCDETAAAVLRFESSGIADFQSDGSVKVLSNIINSQIDTHAVYGGVVPEVASRKHIENISQVVDTAVKTSGVALNQLDGIAVTAGPGLVGALLVGLSFGKALSYGLSKPLLGVHHIEAHISANRLYGFAPPFVCLVASGGHSHLVIVREYGDYEIAGRTRDDACGEAFDKVARALGLGYPGGPKIDAAAKKGNAAAIDFPRAYLEDGSYDFSFSGLKSAVLNYLNKCKMTGAEVNIPDVAASFQEAVTDVLVNKTIKLCNQSNIKKAAIAGGVACNSSLREKMRKKCQENGIGLNIPEPVYCTDNAVMVAVSGYFSLIKGNCHGMDLNAYPNIDIGKLV